MSSTPNKNNNTPLILVADDDEATRLVISATLKREGYHVDCVVNGKEAVEYCQKNSPSLVLMDAIMPGVDGFQATRQLMADCPEWDAPVLIITSLNDTDSVELAFNSGAIDFIPKPIHWPVLLQRVRRLLDAQRVSKALNDERKRAALEKERFECRLRQAHKMEAIGRLTGGVAHDFNNILTAIMGYVDLASGLADKRDDEKLIKYLKEISRASDRARGLIRQMQDYSRQGGGRQPEVVGVRSLVSEVVTLLTSILPTSISIEFCSTAEELHVLVDPVQLHQVIMNLCINARDAMDGKGEITVGVEKCHVDDAMCCSCYTSFHGEWVTISVADSGKGIDAGVLGKIFDPFFTTKDIGQGTGMGLSVVHGIVHHYEGHICVRSTPEGVTCFELYFPVAN